MLASKDIESLRDLARKEGVRSLYIVTLSGDSPSEISIVADDRSYRDPQDTHYPLWSASKPMTAMAIAGLAARGDLEFDGPITDVLSLRGGLLDQVTPRDLLAHQTRIPAAIGDAWTSVRERLEATIDSAPAQQSQLLNYQSFHYLVAGSLLEAVTGKSFGKTLESLITGPAGMASASVNPEVARVPTGHLIQPSGTVRIPREYLVENAAAHGLHITPNDALSLLRWIMDEVPRLDASTGCLTPRADAMGSAVFRISHPFAEEVSYASGWWREKFGGEVFYHHPGLGSGGEAAIGFCPRLKFAYAIFSDAQYGVRAQTNSIQCTRWALYAAACLLPSPDYDAAASRRKDLIETVIGSVKGGDRRPIMLFDQDDLTGRYEAVDGSAVQVGDDAGHLFIDFGDDRLQRRWLFGSATNAVGRLLRDQEIDVTGPATPSVKFSATGNRKELVIQGLRFVHH